MTSSRSLFDRVGRSVKELFRRDPDVLQPVIAESCGIKADVVARDERESGPRRVLNFGHTAGHGLEAVTKYKRFRHGEAVGYGMLVAAEVAVATQRLARRRSRRAGGAHPAARAAAVHRRPGLAEMLEAMRRDKKVVDGRLHYVLATSVGHTSGRRRQRTGTGRGAGARGLPLDRHSPIVNRRV